MTKKLIVITGASSGIGAAIAQVFSTQGYPIALLARNLKLLEQLNLPNSICLAADVTNHIAVKQAIEQAEEKFGPVECLINNAGFAKGGDFVEAIHEDHETTVKVNLLGVINNIEAVLPTMRARKSGTIINISSIADRSARPQLSTYAATKAAVKSLSESLRVANAKYGIRICNFAPAKVATPMLITANIQDEQIIQAEDVAKTVLWIYEQPQAICVRDLVFAPTYFEA